MVPRETGNNAYAKFWGVMSYVIERASGLAKRTIERTKITMDCTQKKIGGTTLYSQ